MHTLRKGAVAALTILVAAAGLAGCGRADSSGQAGASAPPVSEGPAQGTLTVWAMGAEGEALPGLLEKFQADNPGVTVNVTAVPWSSAYDKFKAAIAANETPDVAQVGTTWMGEFVSAGALDPAPDMIDPSKFYEGAQATTEVDGTSYAVPWYVETRLVYYRTDLAQQAGITSPATDWDGLKEMARAMKERGGAEWGISLQPGQTGSWQTVLPFMWSNGGEIMNAAGSAFTLDDAKNVEALAYYQSFFNEGLANKAPVEGTTEADFVSGKVPMFVSGPWMMAAVEKAGGEGFADKYDVMLMPEKEKSVSFVGGSNLAVFKATQNRDAAWKLVDYLTQEDTQVAWYDLTTDLPSVKAAWDADALKSDDRLAKFGEQLETAVAPPSIATWEQVAAKLDAQIEQVTRGGADPAQALATAQAEATSIGMG
ncbi:MAG: sugar ABC transporter substrate-binding protein [Actinomycetes bacterium]